MMVKNYRHAKEEEQLAELLNNKVIQSLVNVYHQLYAEINEFAEVRNRNFRVTSKNNPRLYSILCKAGRNLHMANTYDLYLEFTNEYSVKLIGTDEDAAIILSNKCLEDMTDKQLQAVIGRNLAHIQCGHMIYLNLDRLFDVLFPRIPFVGNAAIEVAKGLLLSWKQCADMTADRGGAVACGSADIMIDTLICQMGGICGNDVSLKKIPLLNVNPISEVNSTIANAVIQKIVDRMDVPFGQQRIINLAHWSNSNQCKQSYPFLYYNSIYGSEYDIHDNNLLFDAINAKNTDINKHLFLLHLAARKGDGQAAAQLGIYYAKGHYGLPKNNSIAIECIRQSAYQGNPDGQYFLGRFYETGVTGFIEKNEQMARWLFRVAASRNQINSLQKKIPVYRIDIRFLYRILEKFEIRQPESIKDSADLHEFLWIPENDKIFSYEIISSGMPDQKSIAICDTGIYQRSEGDIHNWISWDLFQKGNISLSESFGGIRLKLNGRFVWSGVKEDTNSIVYQMIYIGKAIRNS